MFVGIFSMDFPPIARIPPVQDDPALCEFSFDRATAEPPRCPTAPKGCRLFLHNQNPRCAGAGIPVPAAPAKCTLAAPVPDGDNLLPGPAFHRRPCARP